MFKRRIKLTWLAKVKELLWPKMGWLRAVQYYTKRTTRLTDSPKKIAIGLASGIAMSFSPLVGTHILQAWLLTYILRGNLLASLVGTIIGNPWTFPFMWYASITLGSWIFALMGLPANIYLPDEVSLSILWELLLSEPLRILLPWFLGGYLCALILWPIAYFIFYSLINSAKMAREKRLK